MKHIFHLQALKPALLLFSFSLISHLGFSQWSSKAPVRLEHPIELRALEKLKLLEPVKVTYQNSENEMKRQHYSFQAEKFQAAFPELFSLRPYSYRTGKNSYRSLELKHLNLEGLIPVLVAAINELHAEIQDLKMQLEQPGR